MKSIIFTVEKTDTGYSAYAKDYPVFTVGASMKELKRNMLDAINTWMEHKEKPAVKMSQIEVRLDLPQLFRYYKEINAKAIGHRIGMNNTLLSQYINGKKTPSRRQAEKIVSAIRELGNELAGIELR